MTVDASKRSGRNGAVSEPTSPEPSEADLDIDLLMEFHAMTPAERMARHDAALPLAPRERMNPARPTLGLEPARFVGHKNLHVVTTEGVIDLIGQVIAIGDYDAVRAESDELEVGGFSCRVLSLGALIRCKRALARPKDLRVALELEAVQRRLKP